MTGDGFLDALRADWGRQSVDLDHIRRQVAQRRVSARRAAWTNIGGGLLVLLFGAWFAYQALAAGDAVYAIGAAAMLLALPLILAEYAAARRSMTVRIDDTPAGVVRQARDQAGTSLRLLRGCRAGAMILLACAVTVMGLAALGLAEHTLATLLAPVWGGSALIMWFWQSWRGRRLADEIERCDRILAEFSEAEREAPAGGAAPS